VQDRRHRESTSDREGHGMPEVGGGSVQLLEVDPELARGLDQHRAREAAQRLYARAIDVPRGRWKPHAGMLGGSRPIGLLIIDGVLVREATVGDHP
jgi:CRP/FNR family cyclic AMP-dependent transcriptional regulator